MRLAIRRFSAVLAMALAFVALAGCSGTGISLTTAEQAAEEARASKIPSLASPDIHADGVLTVGLKEDAVAPLVMESGDGISGYEVDLASAIADDLGLSVSFRSVRDVASGLKDGCDIVMGAAQGEADGVDVVGDYAESAVGVFRLGDGTVVSADQLAGAKVAMQDGSVAQQVLRASGVRATEVPFSSINESFDALERGEAAFALCHVNSGAYLVTMRPDVAFAGTLDVPTALGIAAPAGTAMRTSLGQSYDRLSGNGVLAAARARWLGSLPTLTAAHQVKNLPQPEQQPSAEPTTSASAVDGSMLDGSTAGANAAVVPGASSGPTD